MTKEGTAETETAPCAGLRFAAAGTGEDVAATPVPLLQFLVRTLFCDPHESPWDLLTHVIMGR